MPMVMLSVIAGFFPTTYLHHQQLYIPLNISYINTVLQLDV